MNDTARHTIPRRLDDPERWLFWTVDEAAALMGSALLGLPPPPRRDCLGDDGLGCALRTLSDADHEEIAIPLADDPARAGRRSVHRLQPHGAVLCALGNAARTAGRGREFRVPAMEKKELLFVVKPLKQKNKSGVEERDMTRVRQGLVALFLAASFLAAGVPEPVRADETGGADPDADAARLVDEVMRRAGGNDTDSLGAWSRSILDRALERAGEAARQSIPGSESGAGRGSTAPLPAERHAGELSGPRSGSGDVLIFTSLSVPAASWRQWGREAARAGAPLVLRGVGEGGLPATAKKIGTRLGGADAGVAIDPRLFRLFGVTRVPAVVVVPGGVPPCRSRSCVDDPAPPHDLVTGNIGLVAALAAVAEEGDAGRGVAKAWLERLGREP